LQFGKNKQEITSTTTWLILTQTTNNHYTFAQYCWV